MSVIEAPTQISRLPIYPRGTAPWRLSLLCVLLLISIGINMGFLLNRFRIDGPLFPFMAFFLAGFGPYLLACAIVLITPAPRGRWRWLELGLIVGGALVLRAMLVGVDPFLSPDAWRYLWDARVTLHGYSPYVYAPQDALLASLRDTNYSKMGFHHVPTIYPPGAQGFYLLGYLMAPESLVPLKILFLLCDLITCLALIYLLKRQGLDTARCIIYAWCPLPVVDFAIQGHLDVIAIMFSMLAILSNLNSGRGWRILTGFLVGMATLSKLYPLLLLVVVMRRRDWLLVMTCLLTILLGYLPYLILGQGQVFGFFAHYADEHSPNSGLVQQLMTQIWLYTGFYNVVLEHIIEAALFGVVALGILWRRWQGKMGEATAILVLIGTLFAVSSHIFPWYATILLPWLALLIRPVWRKQIGLDPGALALAFAWYFLCAIVLHYFFDRLPDWTFYYIIVYDVALAGLCIAAALAIKSRRKNALNKGINQCP